MVRIFRPLNLVIIGVTMFLFWYFMLLPLFERYDLPFILDSFSFLLLLAMTLLVAAGGYVVNDLHDEQTDQINKPGRSIGSTISKNNAGKLYIFLNVAALISAFLVFYKSNNFNVLALCAACILILWLYSRYLKSTILMGNVVVSLLIGLVPFIFVIIEAQAFNQLQEVESVVYQKAMIDVLSFSIFAFFANLIREIVKDCEDYEGDLQAGITTIATGLGYKKSDYFTLTLACTLFILTFLYFSQASVAHYPEEQVFFPLLIFLPLVILIYLLSKKKRTKNKYKLISRAVKVIMLLGLIYIFIHLRSSYA